MSGRIIARAEASPPAKPAPAATEAAPPAASPAAQAPKAKSRKKPILLVLLLAALGAGSYFGHQYWTVGRFFVSTDDAYIAADMSILSPKITGYVAAVPVEENQHVKAGQTIVQIDRGDFELALESAEAKIATQHAAVDRLGAQKAAAEAAVGEAQASEDAIATSLAQAELDLQRASDLVRSGVGAKAQRDSAQSARDQAASKLRGAGASITAATANVAVLDAQVKEAQRTIRELEISRDTAARNLSFTTLTAPYDGIVGNLAVQPGDYLSAGRSLASVVPMSKVFIEANFKETQLAEIVPGQHVEIEVDALPGQKLTGTVVSLSPASGSVFTLLPSDNATGNFTKVVQRVPVRIAIDDVEALDGRLRPGLSAVVAIDSRTGPAGHDTAALN
ncbi:hemolysin D [Aureimonas sp. Leaf460]|nr:hemolysin D [Aureimonas sp. Leaf427]KQT76288.1 hemolysin D [Aureimonas sp. Leaf460]